MTNIFSLIYPVNLGDELPGTAHKPIKTAPDPLWCCDPLVEKHCFHHSIFVKYRKWAKLLTRVPVWASGKPSSPSHSWAPYNLQPHWASWLQCRKAEKAPGWAYVWPGISHKKPWSLGEQGDGERERGRESEKESESSSNPVHTKQQLVVGTC